MVLLNKRIYKISASVGFMANRMNRVDCLFDRGAGPKRIRKGFIEARKLRSIQLNNRQVLSNATE